MVVVGTYTRRLMTLYQFHKLTYDEMDIYAQRTGQVGQKGQTTTVAYYKVISVYRQQT